VTLIFFPLAFELEFSPKVFKTFGRAELVFSWMESFSPIPLGTFYPFPSY